VRPVLTSFGSTGDVQPILALAVGLRRSGHRPLLALSPNLAARVADLGLEFVPIGPEIQPVELHGVITAQKVMANPIEHTRYLVETFAPLIPRMLRELRGACRGADVLISTHYQLASRLVYETTGIPYVSILPSHLSVHSSKPLRDASAAKINTYRMLEGLPTLNDPFTTDALSPQLVLYAISHCLLQRSVAWPAHHHVTGYFFLDEENWRPAPELEEFIAAGDPPVVITLGSVMHDDPDGVTNLLLDAVARANCRAIIQRGWSGLARGQLPKNIIAVGFTPHAWLLPQAACVVHHGGAGVTAATFRAGVPAIIIPHGLDQPIWAEFARSLSCAGSVIPYPQLGAERLGMAISKTLASSNHRQAAAALGERIRAERGVESACQLIEQLLK